ncbi:Diaminopimelate epimerase-like protein [Rickenella mellea]|uniref:Diaminopimelate epimerase-like protein n=1 Tax=Rickenella mellea TaxID=50990 RepID=A0A4Y7Q345_9AGAM|nr:Diaminopimelate epimerase-like protein [Rickenella mellea]
MPPSTLPYTVVDAFTKRIFGGGPASVIVLDNDHGITDETLQLIAREFNFSETAFITPRSAINESASRSFALRWFTPTMEAPICGHATLASAYVLFSSLQIPDNVNVVHFHTLAGELTCRRLEDGKIELELPAGDTTKADAYIEQKAIDVVRKAVGNQVDVKFVGVGGGESFNMFILIQLDDSFDLQRAEIDPSIFVGIGGYTAFILTTTGSTPNEKFISRVFAPDWGVGEDPVCGFAHCMLGPYWQKHLEIQSGEVMVAKQVSKRGGDFEVIWDEKNGTCRLRGHATITRKGELLLPEQL